MPSLIQVQPTIDENPREDRSRQDHRNVNEQLLTAIGEIYSPVLKLMKLFGIYFGDTSLIYLSRTCTRTTTSSRKQSFLSWIYCGVLISGYSLNFIMAFTGIFFGNNLFLYLMFSLWCLLISTSGAVSLFVLSVPLTDTRKSRFENFLRNLFALDINVNLENVKKKSRKGVVAFWIFFIICTCGVLFTNLQMHVRLAVFKPWDQWSGFKIVSLTFLVIGSAVWFLPILFYRITCLILEELFDDLHKRMSSRVSIVSVDFESLKMEHQRLCEAVAFADKMLAPLLFEWVSLYIPLIIINLYKVLNLPEENKYEFLISNMFWLMVSSFFVTIILYIGSNVCEKVSQTVKYCFIGSDHD